MPVPRYRLHGVVGVLAVLALVAGALAAPVAAAPDAPSIPHPEKIDIQLAKAFEAQPAQDFWVQMVARADNSAARSIEDWAARGQAVYSGLRTTADQSQSAVRAMLDAHQADYDSYWIVNAVRVEGASRDLALELSALPSVARVLAPVEYELVEPFQTSPDSGPADGVEWGVADVNADDVWEQFGVRGEGITVANIDTGVQYDHPALVDQYRGNLGGGDFDHNYNWYDAQGAGDVPTDTDGHGTHTMGTMVGDDGAGNQIGVAPGADWIAANGCCPSDQAVIDSMQWMLAPTDLDGENPDPGKRPHVVNNSWTSPLSSDPFGEEIQEAWNAAGIFGQFANGNNGPACETSGSPASRIINYSSGAHDINGVIADFSSRGPGQDGEIKPSISAPGVDVRSSVPDGYGLNSGTSMSSPHVAGVVALLWSAAPVMIGDIEDTRELLDQTAVDVDDTSCGGTAGDNNVYGEGRLDALALLQAAPIGDIGTLTGTVTDADTGDPITGATIELSGPQIRETSTDSDGTYELPLQVGTYDVTVSAFGYELATQTAEISLDTTTTLDLALEPADAYILTGRVRVRETGERLEGATVHLEGTPLTRTTNDTGRYRFKSVPVGTYDLTASTGGCLKSRTKIVVIDGVWPRQSREEFRGDERKRFRLAPATDAYGHRCLEEPSDYVEADTLLPLTGDDDALRVDLPFDFRFYGDQYNKAYVSTNGNLNFLDLQALASNRGMPDPQIPNTTIAPFWDDLEIRADSAVYSATGGTAPDRWFTIEYRNAAFYNEADAVRIDVEVTLHEGGDIVFSYRNLEPTSDLETGGSATVGIENETGTVGLEYSFGDAVLDNETAIRFLLPPGGIAEGTVTDANDELPVAGASVRAWQDEEVVRETTSEADGRYFLQLPLGAYELEVMRPNYDTETVPVVIDEEDETVVNDFALDTGVADVAPDSVTVELPPGQQQSAEVTITNDGTLGIAWELAEADQGSGRVTPLVPANRAAVGQPDQFASAAPQAPGDVLAEWEVDGLDFGVGFDGDVWVSRVITEEGESRWVNQEFRDDGTPTGVQHDVTWSDWFVTDMAFDANTGNMCQIAVSGDGTSDIVCWDRTTGEASYVVPGSELWEGLEQHGLAYNAAEDVFYLGNWYEGIVYTVAGQTHDTPGEVLSQCTPEDSSISGLAYNSTTGTLWMATNSPQDTLYQITTSDCATISTLGDPGPEQGSGAGIELDGAGNIWAVDYADGVVRLIESGVPQESDVPWMGQTPTSGQTAPGETDTFTVTVDSTGLEPGTTYEATLIVKTDAGRSPNVYIPVQLVVSAADGPGRIETHSVPAT